MKTKKPTYEELEAIKAVLYDLERYKGETVIAYEHSLHESVRNLEHFCRKKRPNSKSHDKLFYPAKRLWFRLLWASRPNNTNFKISNMELSSYFIFSLGREKSTDKNPKLAMEWGKLLGQELKKWMTEFPVLERPHD